MEMDDIQKAEEERREAERIREEHERTREELELRRRIGEGGPDQHVPGNVEPGRVEAEEARAIAEEKRLNLRKFYFKMAATVALPLAFVALLPSLIGIYLIDREVDNRIAEGKKTTTAIQESRREFLRVECEDINKRNQNTKDSLNQYEFGAEAREFIYAFINASLPVRVCKDYIEDFAPVVPTDNGTKGG